MDPGRPERCGECGGALLGPFCHRCGQEDRDPRRPLGEIVSEAASSLFGLEARLWPTLVR